MQKSTPTASAEVINQRQHTRYSYEKDLSVIQNNADKERTYYGQGINISQGGILFASNAVLTLGESCLVEFTAATQSKYLKRATVLRAEGKAARDGFSIYAAQFQSPLTEQAVIKILSET